MDPGGAQWAARERDDGAGLLCVRGAVHAIAGIYTNQAAMVDASRRLRRKCGSRKRRCKRSGRSVRRHASAARL